MTAKKEIEDTPTEDVKDESELETVEEVVAEDEEATVEIVEEDEGELPEPPSEEEFMARLSDPNYKADVNSGNNADLEAAKEKIAELEDQVLRTAAEMQNLRNRTQKEVEDTNKYAISNFAKDMIGVLENLRRAQESVTEEDIKADSNLQNLSEGISLTASELLNVFSKHGIERIDPLGEEFDPNLHQALTQIPTDEYEAGKVALVMAAGYKIKERLLRPAMVGVAIEAPKEQAEKQPEETTD